MIGQVQTPAATAAQPQATRSLLANLKDPQDKVEVNWHHPHRHCGWVWDPYQHRNVYECWWD